MKYINRNTLTAISKYTFQCKFMPVLENYVDSNFCKGSIAQLHQEQELHLAVCQHNS